MTLPSFDFSGLIVKPLCSFDKDFFLGLYTDKEVTRFMGGPMLRDKAISFFKSCLQSNKKIASIHRTWSITKTEDNLMVGVCGFIPRTNVSRTADIGIVLSKNCHGRRIASSTLSHLMEYAFKSMNLDEITGYSIPEHTVSKKLMIGLGFSYRQAKDSEPLGHYWSLSNNKFT